MVPGSAKSEETKLKGDEAIATEGSGRWGKRKEGKATTRDNLIALGVGRKLPVYKRGSATRNATLSSSTHLRPQALPPFPQAPCSERQTIFIVTGALSTVLCSPPLSRAERPLPWGNVLASICSEECTERYKFDRRRNPSSANRTLTGRGSTSRPPFRATQSATWPHRGKSFVPSLVVMFLTVSFIGTYSKSTGTLRQPAPWTPDHSQDFRDSNYQDFPVPIYPFDLA